MPGFEMAAVYAAVKLVAYAGWCLFGLRLAAPDAPLSARLWLRALGFGALRWLIGLGLGIVLFFAFATESHRVWTLYVQVYVPVRLLEWGVIGLFLFQPAMRLRAGRWYAWVAGGVLLSFATDLTSPDMIERGRFCVGRCLC
jgi:hypothetical protein